MQHSTDLLPERAFERRIRRIRDLNAEFKSRQRLSSLGGQINYHVQSENDWDLTETVTYNPVSPVFQLAMTFTGNGRQSFPAVFPYIDLRINGITDSNKISYLPGMFGTLGWTDGTTTVLLLGAVRPDPVYFPDPFVQRWTLLLQPNATITYYAKAHAMSSSDGTVQIARV